MPEGVRKRALPSAGLQSSWLAMFLGPAIDRSDWDAYWTGGSSGTSFLSVLQDQMPAVPWLDGSTAADVDLNDPEMTAEERSQYVVKLDTQIGDPVDVLINDRVFAQGEVVSTNVGQPYGVRIISILNEEQQVAAQAERK